jgi:hypothetical protein
MASSSAFGIVAAGISAFQRPVTSTRFDRSPTTTYLRKQHSLGNLADQLDGPNELQEARARLRRVGGNQSPKKEEAKESEAKPPAVIRRRRTNSSLLEELDGLLDTAIGEHTNKLSTTDSRDTTDTTQDWPLPRSHSFTSKSPSKYTSRHSIGAAQRRQSRQRHLRTKNSYVIDSDTSTHARGPSIDSNRPRSSTDTDAGTYRQLPSELEHEPLGFEVPKQLQSSKSPVKHRAALFEKLSHRESAVVHEIPYTHDARNPIKLRGMWPPKHAEKGKDKARVDFIPSLQKHHMKFHHGREEVFAKGSADSPPKSSSPHKPNATHVPPIPLTLPQLVSPRRQSRPDITSSDNSFTTAPQAKCNPVSVTPVKPTEESKTSYSWPLKWDFTRKSPDASIKESSVVARAEPDHHTSAKKSHENQHRVHDLLVAAQEAVKEPTLEPESEKHVKSQRTPPRRPMPGALAETPRTSSTTEKEVASQSSATTVRTVTPSSPRGRRRLQDLEVIALSPKTEKDGAYMLEQRFTLSRSRSRGAGIRVQVDIRSPPSSPERDGNHTVVVTANVEPIQEEEDAVGQAH